jgi:RNA polymerase sigma factor for flagellar operon FliA
MNGTPLQMVQERRLRRDDYEKYQPLVRRTAMVIGRRVPSTVSVADLIGYGWLGLVEAFNRAREGMTAEEFESYALYRVRGAMLDHLRSLDPATRAVRTLSRRVAQAVKALTVTLNRPPEEAEIAAHMGMSVADYGELLLKISSAGMVRLELFDIDGDDALGEGDVEDQASRKEITSAVAAAIEALPERLKTIMTLYYQEECSLKEIGAILGVTESRVCQLHAEAIHRLRAGIGAE